MLFRRLFRASPEFQEERIRIDAQGGYFCTFFFGGAFEGFQKRSLGCSPGFVPLLEIFVRDDVSPAASLIRC